ncbi:Protein very KIND, partial [Ophiophagus hannah]
MWCNSEYLSWQENVSLADVLSLQDSCLTEQDIWAICLECSQSLKNIIHSTVFQTLCITPDTLAFNTNGNVCFMEQISGKKIVKRTKPAHQEPWNLQELVSSVRSNTPEKRV